MNKDFGNLVDLISSDHHKKIQSLFQQIKLNKEFEIMFLNYREDILMNLETFLKLLEFLNVRHNISKGNMKIEKTNQLDIGYRMDDDKMTNYRITVSGLESINKWIGMFHMRRNHVIFTALLSKFIKNEPDITLIKKVKNMDNLLDIDDLKIRFRLSDELSPTKAEIDKLQKIDETIRQNIFFRYKERVSLTVYEDADVAIKIDLTKTKQHLNINKIDDVIPRYELELELIPKEKAKNNPSKNHLIKIYHEIELLLKVIQQSNFVITQELTNKVLKDYQNLLDIDNTRMFGLVARQAHSLEIQHLVDILPNRYAVTDKADGERCFLIISNNGVFLINSNLIVKNTGVVLPNNLAKYNGTILDGELIFVSHKNRYLFMAFDCLRDGDTDMRNVQSILERHEHIDSIIKNCFVQKNQTCYTTENYTGSFDIEKILGFYQIQIHKYLESLNNDIDINPQYPLIRKKIFIPVVGGQKNEIFKYSKLLWNSFTRDNKNKCPYVLDGLIYHPLDQKYIVSIKDSKFHEYKWKPETKNSIDFYITFERDNDTGKVVTLYDNSRDEYIKGKPYKICYLHVGKNNQNGEQPVLFQQESNKHVAYLFLDNGDVRDPEGNILQDKTVVEFYYNTDPDVEDKFRWTPLKTRYDKTESVIRFKRKYGNYSDIATRVWRSIINPVRFDDLNLLSDDRIFESHLEKMRKKIDHSLIMSERKENIYYQIKTNLAHPMRNFHNFVKSIIIYTYFNPVYNHGHRMSILDLGCGRGGDIMKFKYSNVAHYVGIDVDLNGLVAATDGALSRYRQLKKNHPNFPPMYFIHGDARVLLNYDDQLRALGSMSDQNKALLEKFFPAGGNHKNFDGINCQFALHYFLESDTTWNNFCETINKCLKEGGYALFSCFDAQRVVNLLHNKQEFASFYNDEKGEKMRLFEIKKSYEQHSDPNHTYGTGNAIDVYNSLISQEDVYNTEYLVDIRFLTTQLSEKCDLELIESDFLDHLYYINQDYITDIKHHEGNIKTRQYLENAGQYYKMDEVNKACFEMTKLNRYYVFRRRQHGKITPAKSAVVDKRAKTRIEHLKDKAPVVKSKSKKSQSGGKFIKDLSSIDYLLGDGFEKGYIKEGSSTSFYDSVTFSLKKSNVIPSSIDTRQFCKDINVDIKHDTELTDRDIIKISNIKIEHNDDDDDKQTVINGVDIYVLNKDCDDDVEVIRYNSKNNKQAIILYKDNDAYYPVINGDKSLFLNKDKVIKNLHGELS